VPDEIWDEAARHYDGPALAALILSITTTNVFNRLNLTTRQVAGAWTGSGAMRTIARMHPRWMRVVTLAAELAVLPE